MAARIILGRNLVMVLALGVFFLGLPACGSRIGPALDTGKQGSINTQADREGWQEGLRAFDQKDYYKAEAIFKVLSGSSRDAEISRKALYGLGTVRLILAQTPEEYAEAVLVWKQWSSQPRPIGQCEDPAMISPLIDRFSSSIAQTAKTEPREEPRRVSSAPRQKMPQSKLKEVETLRARLESREREIRRLRHQLESLEEIHRKYQEKKQEASP